MIATLGSNVLLVLGGLFATLVAASGVGHVLERGHRSGGRTELSQRIRSWWIIVSVFALVLLLNRTVSLVFFGLVSFLALKEYFSLIPTRRADRRVLFWAYWAIPLQYYWIGTEWYGMFIIFIPVYMFLFLPVGMLLAGETQGFLRAAGTLQWGLMTTVFSLSHVAFLLVLPAGEYPGVSGAGLVLFLVVLTQLNDVAQYCLGKLLGRRKVMPKVSPNKTWVGLLGGVLTTILLSLLLSPLLTPLGKLDAALVGAMIGVAGFFGDVSLSALKRDLGIKDSGTLIPGHGGILDRVDSLTYTAPLFFHFIRYYYF